VKVWADEVALQFDESSYRSGLPQVLIRDSENRESAVVEPLSNADFVDRYISDGKPRLALFWNHHFNDDISADGYGLRVRDPGLDFDQLRAAFDQRLLEAGTILVDRSASIRFSAISEEGVAIGPNGQAIEALAVLRSAEQLLEVRFVSDGSSERAHFRLLEAASGNLLMNIVTDALPVVGPISERTVAGPDGYSVVSVSNPLSARSRGTRLAEIFMAEFVRM
jgi:hypothetical protein